MNEKEMIIHLFQLAGFEKQTTENFDGWVCFSDGLKQGYKKPETFKEAIEIVQHASRSIGFNECRKRFHVISSTNKLTEDL